ncbi:MAG: DUF72 domain-containing protein [Bacteroidota bacterium]|jgi:uncharacterized protein YecE (DUF72 family)|nr:DUF72 domain-containing protein [Ignavibacteria bacterium]MCU7497699.1 DUF72 domain-containing protein [Ignavibacteria bacterium]MCU7510996.1 DUF72 domain-containing protein [Ignavibacteria bacterium]MCU7518850.1 DUF72 domain-containing protein [Ignavibacteria bacterium]MCU7523182.1 DUF72 domain-containing protein [Ignavibacteria bacterium]
MPNTYIGTAGWSYKDWVPNFYPKGQSAGFDWLEFYSRYFNMVEVNATYYAYLSPKAAAGWVEKVEKADNFLFTVKLHQDFTHARKFEGANIKAVQANLDILAAAGRLGGLLIQFPYSFAFNSAALEHVRLLNDIFGGCNRFLEVRHSSWNNEEAYHFLHELDISLCTIDQPQLGRSVAFEPVITNSRAYFRFHGRNTEAWKQSVNNYGKSQTYEQASERYKYLYSPGELVEIENKIKEIYDSVKDVYVVMNNHPSTYGIVNAFEMMHMLRGRNKITVPLNALKAFPRLTPIALAG